MARVSRLSLESLFDDSCGAAGRPANVREPAAHLKPSPRPKPRPAVARRSVPPQRGNMTKGCLQNIFPSGQDLVEVRKHSHCTARPLEKRRAPWGTAWPRDALGKRLAGLTAGGHTPAGLAAGRSAPPSPTRKRAATSEPFPTSGAIKVNTKRPLLEDLFGSETLAREDAACRTYAASSSAACGSAVNAQPVVQICGTGLSLAVSRRTEPQTALHELVGAASESEAEHCRRHPKLRSDCPRCRFINFGNAWKQGPGALTHAARGGREKIVWLAERPPEHGGFWALGCVLCAALLYRLSK